MANTYTNIISAGRSHWSKTALTFSFDTTIPSYYHKFNPSDPAGPYYALSAITATIWSKLYGHAPGYASYVEDVTPLTFSKVANGGDLVHVGYTPADKSFMAQTQLPSPTAPDGQRAGDTYIYESSFLSYPAAGQLYAASHEIGHSLGLLDAKTGGLTGIYDSMKYTGMSYNYDAANNGVFPVGLQQYDIAALQSLYGANFSTRSGDTVYSFSSNPGLLTIWDGAGKDKVDTSAMSSNVSIDLQPGHFSSIGGVENIAMASVNHLAAADRAKPLIENAKAGAGNDTLIGNVGDNALEGGAGTNKLTGLAGNDLLLSKGTNDTLDGGPGDDWLFNLDSDGHTTYVFGKGYGHDQIEDNPYSSNGITVSLPDLAPSDVQIIVERWNANEGNPGSNSPAYAYAAEHLLIKATGDTLILPWSYRDNPSDYDYSGDSIVFGKGGLWDMAHVEQYMTFQDVNEATFTTFDPVLYAAQTHWDITPFLG